MARRWPYSTALWRYQVAPRVLLRDGYRCQIRLPGCLGRASSADHIVELADGGAPFDLRNLQAACMHCNLAKSHRENASRQNLRPW